MREFILKREGVVRLVSLMMIAVSVFVDEKEIKIGALLIGILGLIMISSFKKQKVQAVIFTILLVVSIAIVYWKT